MYQQSTWFAKFLLKSINMLLACEHLRVKKRKKNFGMTKCRQLRSLQFISRLSVIWWLKQKTISCTIQKWAHVLRSAVVLSGGVSSDAAQEALRQLTRGDETIPPFVLGCECVAEACVVPGGQSIFFKRTWLFEYDPKDRNGAGQKIFRIPKRAFPVTAAKLLNRKHFRWTHKSFAWASILATWTSLTGVWSENQKECGFVTSFTAVKRKMPFQIVNKETW